MKEFIMKETEELTTFGNVWKRYDPVKELIRCKDCRHYDETQRGKPRAEKRRYVCDDFNPPDDWFCADGKQKES